MLTTWPRLPGEHAGHDGAGQQDRGFEVDGERVGEVCLGRLLESTDPLDAGVVHQDVDRAEFGLGALQQARPVGAVGHVADGGDRRDAECFDLGAHLLEVALRPRRERQVRSLLRQRAGDVHPDAA